MSETHTTRRNRNHEAAPEAAPQTETSAAPDTSYLNHAAQPAPTFNPADPFAFGSRPVEFKEAGLTVDLPVRFTAGMVMDETLALIVQEACERQFTNNTNANAKARAERLAKAATDAERAANQPYTAADIAKAFETYLPNIGRAGVSLSERMRQDAGWKAYVKIINEHNAWAKSGEGSSPLGAAAPKAQLNLLNAKGANKEETAKLREAEKESIIQTMLTKPAYAERVQVELDAIMAERAAAKAEKASKPEAAAVAAFSLL